MYGQLLNLLDKQKILRFSREMGGERYVKHFDAWQHLVIMLYAVIKRFDSLREITDSMFPEARKLELFQPGNHVPHHAYVLRQLLYFLRTARTRLAQNPSKRESAT